MKCGPTCSSHLPPLCLPPVLGHFGRLVNFRFVICNAVLVFGRRGDDWSTLNVVGVPRGYWVSIAARVQEGALVMHRGTRKIGGLLGMYRDKNKVGRVLCRYRGMSKLGGVLDMYRGQE